MTYTQSQLDEAVRAAVEAEREAIAKYCEMNAMATPYARTKPVYAGFVPSPVTEDDGGRHAGMGYAAAIRARGEMK